MTALLTAPRTVRPELRRARARWGWGLGAVAVLGWSLAGAGLFSGDVTNPAGAGQFGRFAVAALSPALDPAFLRVLATGALVTVAYAALGAALAVVLGAVGAVAVARTTWGRRRAGWTPGAARARCTPDRFATRVSTITPDVLGRATQVQAHDPGTQQGPSWFCHNSHLRARGAERPPCYFEAASNTAWLQAPSGFLLMTGSLPPLSRPLTVRS